MSTSSAVVSSKYDELMVESMTLVPKMIRILEARGMPPSSAAKKLDFGPVEEALGCSLPEDFKAISDATGGVACWAITIESLMTPSEILKERQSLEKAYSSNANCVELDWSKDKCFVPIAQNSSAFYYGYIKNKTKNKCTKLVRLDGEGSLEYNERSATDLPLGILMYRFVVRAVTKEVWEVHGTNLTVSDFWTSEGDAEDRDEGMACSALDGSQDHAASSDGIRIVVLGRPVCYLDTPDYDEEEQQDFEIASVFQGSSKEDFMGVGVYGVTHPMDQEEEDREREVNEAPKRIATISMVGLEDDNQLMKLTDLGFDSDITNLMENHEMESRIVKATILKQRLAVGRQSTALIVGGPDDGGSGIRGSLALLDPLDERLWYSTEANRRLEAGESFTQVAVVGEGRPAGYALTSKNRLLKWTLGMAQGQPAPEFQWVDLPSDLGPIRQLEAAQGLIALVLQDGRLATVDGAKGVVFVPGVDKAARISAYYDDILILHTDGSVSISAPRKDFLVSRVECPSKIVGIHKCGKHDLLLATNGCVYGFGTASTGALPLAVTPERIAAYEASQKKFKEQLTEMEQKLDAFDIEMKKHCESCPKAVKPPAKKPKFPPSLEEDPRQNLMFRIQCASIIHGVNHTPETCGAPAVPEDLKKGPDVPLPCETNFSPPDYDREPSTEAILLTVGPEHERLMDVSSTLTPQDSWNSVKGPYGLPCASTTPVVAVTGSYNSSIFLHQDGKLSGCGKSSELTLGFRPPEEDEEEEEEEEGKEDDKPAVPIVSRHLYSQKAGHCYITVIEDIGMPAAASIPDEVQMIAVESGVDGSLAVDSQGRVWGCGATVGRGEPGSTYEVLHVLEKQKTEP